MTYAGCRDKLLSCSMIMKEEGTLGQPSSNLHPLVLSGELLIAEVGTRRAPHM